MSGLFTDQRETSYQQTRNNPARSIGEWTWRATGHIRFAPDRKPVEEELKAQYVDHRDALLEAGESRERASFLALQAMGDPDEAGELLAKIHTPWLGWAWKASQVLAVVMVIALLISQAVYRNTYIWPYFEEYEFEPYILSEKTLQSGKYEVVREGTGGQTVHVGDYRIHITDWKVMHRLPGEQPEEYPVVICLEMRTVPWLGWSNAFAKYLRAEDSLGTVYRNWPYEARTEETDVLDPQFSLESRGSSFWTHRFFFLLQPCDPSIEWVRFTYNHGGTSLSFTVPLTEGAQ